MTKVINRVTLIAVPKDDLIRFWITETKLEFSPDASLRLGLSAGPCAVFLNDGTFWHMYVKQDPDAFEVEYESWDKSRVIPHAGLAAKILSTTEQEAGYFNLVKTHHFHQGHQLWELDMRKKFTADL